MTPHEFLEARPEMPERGQWSELAAGRPVHFDAPDVEHGDVLGNLSGKLAGLATQGTPVFRLGLRTAAETLRFPAVAYFGRPGRFDLMDAESTEEPPDWVVEVAAAPDRLKAVPELVAEYASMGVKLVWVVDPATQSVHSVGGAGTGVASGEEPVTARPVADFESTPAALCAAPSWYA